MEMSRQNNVIFYADTLKMNWNPTYEWDPTEITFYSIPIIQT